MWSSSKLVKCLGECLGLSLLLDGKSFYYRSWDSMRLWEKSDLSLGTRTMPILAIFKVEKWFQGFPLLIKRNLVKVKIFPYDN